MISAQAPSQRLPSGEALPGTFEGLPAAFKDDRNDETYNLLCYALVSTETVDSASLDASAFSSSERETSTEEAEDY